MSLDDSGEDLFITQSTFRSEENVSTQEADDAAEFLLDTSLDLTPNSQPEVVQYMDFSHEHANNLVNADISACRKEELQEPFLPLMADLFDDEDLAKVDDNVLSGALDAVMAKPGDLDHFGKLLSKEEMNAKKCKGYSDATKRKLQWAYRVYFYWKLARNCRSLQEHQTDEFIGDIFEMEPEKLCDVLTKFVLEVRKTNGEMYPSDTLYELVLSLQMYLALHGRTIKFIDDPIFEPLKNTLDNHMQQLAKEGKHRPGRKAEVISIEDENRLWENNVLGESNPKQLLDTVLYQLGVHFALRAGCEHRDLRLGEKSQFSIKHDCQAQLDYLEYVEDTSKNNRGGLNHRKVDSKVGRAYENKLNPERCLVRLFRKYVSLHPKGEKVPDDFYLRPLTNFSESTWYGTQPVGKNKLATIVVSMAKEIGLKGKITNHSLRATAASRLYQSNVDEQLVMERTGHRSTAVRSYKRTSNDQLRNISNLLYGQDSEPPAKKVCTEARKESGVSSCKDSEMISNNRRDNQDGANGSKFSFNFTINLPKVL